MASKDFQWNKRPEEELPRAHALESKRYGASEEVALSHYLVDIHSALDQLQNAYLSSEQRRQLATSLSNGFFGLQRIASAERDHETRVKLTHYLVVVGSIGVNQMINQEKCQQLLTLLEALSHGTLIEWANCFYSATHGIEQPDNQGRQIGYCVSEESLEGERATRHELMLWIEK